MHNNKVLTYRVDVKVAFADPCFVGRTSECIKSLEFTACESESASVALKMVEENRALLLSGVDSGHITALYLWPLTLQCRLADGKVDLRGWLYDRKILWLKEQRSQEARRPTPSSAGLRTFFQPQNVAG